jgi:hypothetical protein
MICKKLLQLSATGYRPWLKGFEPGTSHRVKMIDQVGGLLSGLIACGKKWSMTGGSCTQVTGCQLSSCVAKARAHGVSRFGELVWSMECVGLCFAGGDRPA